MLDRDDIATLLDELASELEAEGVHGDLFLVGGAANLADRSVEPLHYLGGPLPSRAVREAVASRL